MSVCRDATNNALIEVLFLNSTWNYTTVVSSLKLKLHRILLQ
jgi:hypothetical protein